MPKNFSGLAENGLVISNEFWNHQICCKLLNNSEAKAMLKDCGIDADLADSIEVSNLIVVRMPEALHAICKDSPDRYRLVE